MQGPFRPIQGSGGSEDMSTRSLNFLKMNLIFIFCILKEIILIEGQKTGS